MTQRLAKTELFAKWLGGTLAVDNQDVTTGRRVYVSSDTGTDAGGYGANPDAPVATWDYAVGLCTANQHDIIYIMPGHTETLTNSSRVTLDMAGVRSIGLGSGTDRPTFTFATDTTADVLVSSANNTIENMIFVNGVNNQAEMIDVDATDCTIRNCEFRWWCPSEPGLTQ